VISKNKSCWKTRAINILNPSEQMFYYFIFLWLKFIIVLLGIVKSSLYFNDTKVLKEFQILFNLEMILHLAFIILRACFFFSPIINNYYSEYNGSMLSFVNFR